MANESASSSKSKRSDASVLESAKTIVSVTPTRMELPPDVVTALRKLTGAAPSGADAAADAESPVRRTKDDDPVVTKHSVRLASGKTLNYQVTVQRTTMRDEDGTEKARIFSVVYTNEGIGNRANRPITFCFNGGPGSSSVWLHIGAFGPKRIVIPDDATQPRPPYALTDNIHTLLDVSDLVFIDPVSTGFSRAAHEDGASEYHEVGKDIESVGDFIRLYCTREKRWASPKFLAGESYGTTRAAGLSGYLQDRHGMYLNGIVLVSSVLNFQTLAFDAGNDLPFIVFLPTYCSTAWYHKQLSPTLLKKPLRDLMREVGDFAFGRYTHALTLGTNLDPGERARLIAQVSKYTGVSREIVDECELRVPWDRFCDELMRSNRQCVGRLDSRFKSFGEWAMKENWLLDPSYTAILGAYSGAFNHYVRTDLSYENDLQYEIISERVQPWSYAERASNRYLDVAETLETAMRQNHHLRVIVTNGYYDLATPHAGTEYTFSRLSRDRDLLKRISMKYYEAGHMMYVHEPSLKKLKTDIAEFLLAEGE